MDIMVEGIASRFFKPDRVRLDINFYTKRNTYQEALNNGTENVEIFIKEVIETLDISKEELKTRSFTVSEVTKYDYDKKENIKDGFSYSQFATLRIDYDLKKISEFMEKVSKLKNPPMYRINFEVKNEEKAKSLVIADAYSKAEEKAKMIALAAGKKLKECVKVDFRPFEEKVISNTNLGSFFKAEKSLQKSVSETIQNVFTPEDVKVSEALYCLWIAE